MHIVVSVPSGFHARELLLPLKPFFDNDQTIQKITVISSGSPYQEQLFSDYGAKFSFTNNPETPYEHVALLKELQPSLVVTTTSGIDQLDVPILEAAKKLNIKTLTFVGSWDNVWKMERTRDQDKSIVIADDLVVWTDIMRTHLLKAFPEATNERIHTIGSPRLDYLTHADKIPSSDQVRDYLGIPKDNKPLLHIATVELYPMEYIVKPIAETFGESCHLYASVHPGGTMANHQHYAEKYGVTVHFSFGRTDNPPTPAFAYNPSVEDIYMLNAVFKHSAVLINHSSTVAIESFAYNVPVVNIKYGRPLDWWRWHRSAIMRDFKEHYKDITVENGTAVVKNEKQLINAITNYLADPTIQQAERATTLKKMITTTDGTASEQLFNLIKSKASS